MKMAMIEVSMSMRDSFKMLDDEDAILGMIFSSLKFLGPSFLSVVAVNSVHKK